jgi:threonine/homoserine/homoserine lactone efflux protein
MTLDAAALIPVVLVLMGGAVSPGPSLAVVLRNTIVGGRARGVACSVGHGIGFGIYAFLAISGIALLKSVGMQWATALELAGAVFLVYIGVTMIRAPERDLSEEGGHPESEREGFIEGFLIAFLNPKVFVFLTAIFSQFIDAGMVVQDRLILAAVALFIDTTWYVIVATTLSGTPMLEKLREQGKKVDIAVGIILLALAAAVVWSQFL